MMSGGDRIRFRERQVLSELLLAGEQDYQRQRQHLHQSRQHTPGIVSGLAVTFDESGTAWVSPGLAIDGTGRRVCFAEAVKIELPAAGAKPQGPLDVFVDLETAPANAGPPATRDDAGQRSEPSRWRDTPRAVVRPEAAGSNGSSGDIRVGRIGLDGNGNWSSLAAERQYAGIVADRVKTPVARSQLRIGPGMTDDSPAFAVSDGDGTRSFLFVDTDGNAHVPGNLAIHSALRQGPGSLRFKGPGAGAAPPPGDKPSPWSIGVVAAPDGKGQQLRLAAGGGGAAEPVCVRIGRRGQDGFQPIVTITEQGDVIVEGALRAVLPETPAPADPSDPRFAQALAAAVKEGVAASVPPVDGSLKLDIVSVELTPADRCVTVTVKLSNNSADSVTDVVVQQTLVSGPDFMRSRKVWPSDGAASLAPAATQAVTARTQLSEEEWPAGKPVQVTVRATAKDAAKKNIQTFAIHNADVPPPGADTKRQGR